MAQDLQEPLRTIDSFTQLLVRRFAKDGEEAVELAGFVSGGVERMRALLRDLLAYSKVELGAGRVPADVDCSQALADALADLTAAIERTGARITCDHLPVVRGDRTQLTQVFRNLVGNAIKFSGPGPPEIAVTCEDPGDHWHFSVRDHGIGIRAKDREAVFLLFKQLHAAEQYEGTGLGLAITKKIVEQHGGTIWVESEPGVGSVFHFTLPKKD